MVKDEKTYLGFDFGMKRIGVAVGQNITLFARALTTLKATDGIPDWEQISHLINTWRPSALIVGIPVNLDGAEQPITSNAKRFANRLKHKFNLPVFGVDERLTTKEAQSLFAKQVTPQVQLDSFAAKLILESWLKESVN